MDRTIALCKQNGSFVYVYNAKGSVIFTKPGKLVGYTATTVSVQNGSKIYVYDNRGVFKFAR